jgi:hypothetical protein
MTGKYGGPAGAKPFAMSRRQWYDLRMTVTINSSVDAKMGGSRCGATASR